MKMDTNVFAFCCLAVAMNDLQSLEQQFIVFSLTFTWQYPVVNWMKLVQKHSTWMVKLVRPMEGPLLLTEFVAAQF